MQQLRSSVYQKSKLSRQIWAQTLIGLCCFAPFFSACGSGEEQVPFEDLSLEEKREKTKALGLMVYEVTQTDLTATSVTVNFYTVEDSTSGLVYGLDLDALSEQVEGIVAEPAKEHSIAITGLTPETKYYVRPVATDASGRIFQDPSIYPITTRPFADDKDGQVIALVPDQIIASSTLGGSADEAAVRIGNVSDSDPNTQWLSDGEGSEATVELQFDDPTTISGFFVRSAGGGDSAATIRSVTIQIDERTYNTFETPEPTREYRIDLNPPQIGSKIIVSIVDSDAGNTGYRTLRFF